MSRPSVIAIVQARLGSTLLPSMAPMGLEGRPMLGRLASAPALDAIATATTTDPRDPPIVGLATRLGVRVTRDSESDVIDPDLLPRAHTPRTSWSA
jgi:spore coat polysaccharide biosynthesis protein SpsF (cytidylyltransferase family)